MDVAVTGVEDVDDPQVVFPADLLDSRQDIGQASARHDAVLRAIAGAQPPDRTEGLLAAFPKLLPLLGRLRQTDLPGSALVANLRDACLLPIESGFEPIDFDEQYGLGVEREAEVECLFDRFDNPLIHHLQRGRNDPRSNDAADRTGGVVHRVENAEHRAPSLRVGGQANPDLRHDPERPFAADECAEEIDPGRVFRRPAERHDLSIGEDDLRREHMVHGDAILERVGATGIGRYIATERARSLARRVGRIVKSRTAQCVREPFVHASRFHDGVPIPRANLEDLLHARQDDHHASADRQAATGETRSCTARKECDLSPAAELDDSGYLVRRLGEDHDIRRVLLDRKTIALVDQLLGPRREHMACSDDPLQLAHQRGGALFMSIHMPLFARASPTRFDGVSIRGSARIGQGKAQERRPRKAL